MHSVIIVEGKNDKEKLLPLLNAGTEILCTYGMPSHHRVEELKSAAAMCEVFIFTDNDRPGRRIRAILREAFPDAAHMYTKKGYAGVEGTPLEHLLLQLEKHDLLHPDPEWLKTLFPQH